MGLATIVFARSGADMRIGTQREVELRMYAGRMTTMYLNMYNIYSPMLACHV
jgi:hypothetical protein